MSPLTVTLPSYLDSPPVDEDDEERDEDAEEEELDVNVVPADCSASVFKLCPGIPEYLRLFSWTNWPS